MLFYFTSINFNNLGNCNAVKTTFFQSTTKFYKWMFIRVGDKTAFFV